MFEKFGESVTKENLLNVWNEVVRRRAGIEKELAVGQIIEY